MFTDKDSIQDFHDENDYLQVGFQILSALSLVRNSVLSLTSRINLKTFVSFLMITLFDFNLIFNWFNQ